jgi:hypothetical protein
VNNSPWKLLAERLVWLTLVGASLVALVRLKSKEEERVRYWAWPSSPARFHEDLRLHLSNESMQLALGRRGLESNDREFPMCGYELASASKIVGFSKSTNAEIPGFFLRTATSTEQHAAIVSWLGELKSCQDVGTATFEIQPIKASAIVLEALRDSLLSLANVAESPAEALAFLIASFQVMTDMLAASGLGALLEERALPSADYWSVLDKALERFEARYLSSAVGLFLGFRRVESRIPSASDFIGRDLKLRAVQSGLSEDNLGAFLDRGLRVVAWVREIEALPWEEGEAAAINLRDAMNYGPDAMLNSARIDVPRILRVVREVRRAILDLQARVAGWPGVSEQLLSIGIRVTR